MIVLVQKLNHNSHPKCKSKSTKTTRTVREVRKCLVRACCPQLRVLQRALQRLTIIVYKTHAILTHAILTLMPFNSQQIMDKQKQTGSGGVCEDETGAPVSTPNPQSTASKVGGRAGMFSSCTFFLALSASADASSNQASIQLQKLIQHDGGRVVDKFENLVFLSMHFT